MALLIAMAFLPASAIAQGQGHGQEAHKDKQDKVETQEAEAAAAQQPQCPDPAAAPDPNAPAAPPLTAEQDTNANGIDDRCPQDQQQPQPVEPVEPDPVVEQPVEPDPAVEQPVEPEPGIETPTEPVEPVEPVEPFTINVLRADAPVLAPKAMKVPRSIGKFEANDKAAALAKSDVKDKRFFPWVGNGLLAAAVLVPLVLGILTLRLGLRSGSRDEEAAATANQRQVPRRQPRPPRPPRSHY